MRQSTDSWPCCQFHTSNCILIQRIREFVINPRVGQQLLTYPDRAQYRKSYYQSNSQSPTDPTPKTSPTTLHPCPHPWMISHRSPVLDAVLQGKILTPITKWDRHCGPCGGKDRDTFLERHDVERVTVIRTVLMPLWDLPKKQSWQASPTWRTFWPDNVKVEKDTGTFNEETGEDTLVVSTRRSTWRTRPDTTCTSIRSSQRLSQNHSPLSTPSQLTPSPTPPVKDFSSATHHFGTTSAHHSWVFRALSLRQDTRSSLITERNKALGCSGELNLVPRPAWTRTDLTVCGLSSRSTLSSAGKGRVRHMAHTSRRDFIIFWSAQTQHVRSTQKGHHHFPHWSFHHLLHPRNYRNVLEIALATACSISYDRLNIPPSATHIISSKQRTPEPLDTHRSMQMCAARLRSTRVQSTPTKNAKCKGRETPWWNLTNIHTLVQPLFKLSISIENPKIAASREFPPGH